MLLKFGRAKLLRRRVMSDYTVYWPRYSGGFEIVAFLRTARPKKREHEVLQASYAFGFAKPDAPADAWKPPINHTDEWREWKGSQKRMYAAIKRLFDSVHVPGRDGHMYLFTKDDHEIFGHNVPFRTFVPEDESERRRPEMDTRSAAKRKAVVAAPPARSTRRRRQSDNQ
jgi:hypothetical protein